MKVNDKIKQLIETRINGNSFEASSTYKTFLKNVKISDIKEYASMRYNEHVNKVLYCMNRKKDMINLIFEHERGLV